MSALGTHPGEGREITATMHGTVFHWCGQHWVIFTVVLLAVLYGVKLSRRQGLWSLSFTWWRITLFRKAR